MYSMENKVVVITGAAGEIPRAISKIMADAGSRLVLTDINEASLNHLYSSFGDNNEVSVLCHDVADQEDAKAVAEFCRERYGHVDIVVTGAGLYEYTPLDELDSSLWRKNLSINLDGVFYTIQALRPLLTMDSAIVNIASIAGHRGSLGHTSYATAKGGVLALSRSLAAELGPRTRVNAVSPGLIDTRMVQALDAQRREAMVDAMPLQRMGSAREVAQVVAFLCSSMASYITGETIHVNGGLYIAS